MYTFMTQYFYFRILLPDDVRLQPAKKMLHNC